jgi:hypothetical protein
MVITYLVSLPWPAVIMRKLDSARGYTCRKISPSFVDRYKYKRWLPASRGTWREGKRYCKRLLAPPLPFHLPFPSYCDADQALRFLLSLYLKVAHSCLKPTNRSDFGGICSQCI